MGKLEGKVAIITGGSRGIGSAVCKALAASGAKVIVNYQGDRDSAVSTLEAIKSRGGEGEIYQADVVNYKDCEAMVKYAVAQWGKVDILVNNAGVNRDNLLPRMKNEEWEQVVQTNLTGTYNCTKAAIRPFLKQKTGGRIINMASVAGIYGNIGQANYSAAKGGIIAFSKSMAKELGSRGITVNAVAPGMIETEMTQALSQEVMDESRKRIALERLGKPEEVAQAVLFLAESGDYITGEVISVDGGIAL